jgi:hypothetical protein
LSLRLTCPGRPRLRRANLAIRANRGMLARHYRDSDPLAAAQRRIRLLHYSVYIDYKITSLNFLRKTKLKSWIMENYSTSNYELVNSIVIGEIYIISDDFYLSSYQIQVNEL